MTNSEIIHKFYTSFSDGDSRGMADCYHTDIIFQDPVFGTLKGERASKMWEMLLSSKNSQLKVTFGNITANTEEGKANWTAEYVYDKQKRKVVNHVSASFKFKEGKIIEHIDSFDLWKWTRQALGIPGYIFGWTPMMKNKIRSLVNTTLDGFEDLKKKNSR